MCLLRRMNLLFLQCLSARYRIQSMFPRFEVEFDYSIMVIPHICLIFAETISSNFTVIYCLSLFSSIYCVFLPQGLGFEYYSWCPKRYHWSGQKFTSEQSFQVFAIKWQTRQCYSLICDRLCSNAASFSKKRQDLWKKRLFEMLSFHFGEKFALSKTASLTKRQCCSLTLWFKHSRCYDNFMTSWAIFLAKNLHF